ncbi:hypothetical protein GLOIN_2v1722824 [Rhizophagus clarus]|uniref:Uncharacterized protein n=1 Tax=Rhizophagus clarus TaxID=94130 RepID=A0A8H3QKL9_9GLOM|nr:hypothetical protein GLOIN_2v1722824 [Rhizophagus clarus]
MPKDTPVRWESSELVKILTYVNNNIDIWCLNHKDASLKAIEATNNNKRDPKSVYNKVYSLIKAYEKFDTTSTSSGNCNIIWENTRVHDLVRKIYTKIKDRKKKKNNNQEKKKNEGSQDHDDDGDVEMADSTEQVTPNTQSTANRNVSQKPFSTELVEKLYDEKCQQIAELRVQLTKTVESTKSVFEKVNCPLPFQSDSIDNTSHFNNFEIDNSDETNSQTKPSRSEFANVCLV